MARFQPMSTSASRRASHAPSRGATARHSLAFVLGLILFVICSHPLIHVLRGLTFLVILDLRLKFLIDA